MMRKQIWSKNGKLEYMPDEPKEKKKGIGIIPAAWKVLFGEDADTAQVERVASGVGGGVVNAGRMVGQAVKKGGVVGAPFEYLDQAIDPYVQAYQDIFAMPVQKGMDKSSVLIKQLLEKGK
jgi:hypothetical protein